MMNRRKFIKYLSATGMTLTLPGTLSYAQASPNRFWITVNAAGGWDPTMMIDPKGNVARSDGRGPVNNYSTGIIDMAGNIPFAAGYPDDVDPPESTAPGHYANFFPKHASRLLVINGIDTQTNNHDAGSRYVWSGKIEEGYPSFTALAAANGAPNQPLSFISNGGYDNTASLVAPARIGDGDVFARLAFPNAGNPSGDADNLQEYFNDVIYADIEAARNARMTRQIAKATLPLQQRQLQELRDARGGDSNLNQLVDLLPDNTSRGLRGQAEVAAAAFAAGVAVSANLNIGGFDTHGNHDFNQSRRMTELLDGVDHLWGQIESHGLQDRVTVLVGSDFGRTPFYNDDRGKDHWNVTSMMAMGAGVRGNRVIGGSNALVEAQAINPTTLALDPGGVILTPQHIHVALRAMAGVSSDLNGQFSISESFINLFS